MVRYEVTLDVEPGIGETLERYMRGEHIPEIHATGCFREIRLERASATRLRTSYLAAARQDLERYLADHAPSLRAKFASDFPAGVVVSRETWIELERWP